MSTGNLNPFQAKSIRKQMLWKRYKIYNCTIGSPAMSTRASACYLHLCNTSVFVTYKDISMRPAENMRPNGGMYIPIDTNLLVIPT